MSLSLVSILGFAVSEGLTAMVRAQDLTGDGKPDLLWRRVNQKQCLAMANEWGDVIAAGYELQSTVGQEYLEACRDG